MKFSKAYNVIWEETINHRKRKWYRKFKDSPNLYQQKKELEKRDNARNSKGRRT